MIHTHIALASLLLVSPLLAGPQEARTGEGGPELLPTASEGWRFERLDLPLDFAPDLDYRGFEELRFAPGMFEPDSDSYFSYVMSLRLDGDHKVDASFWKGFLESYYRGLCTAVGSGRGLEIDADSITASVVVQDDRIHVATIDMVDAFVTGKPLRLRLELESHPTPHATEVLGIVSPLPLEAEVWNELRDLRAGWREARAMPVFLNHLFVVPDAETYAALAGSEFLREAFGTFEARRTVRQDLSYEGVYWYGSRTYFEFLPPGSPPLTEGSTGVSFGIEVRGGTKKLAAALKELGVQTFAGPRTRELEGEAIPWFEIMGISGASTRSKLSLFSMEYAPEFLEKWHPELAPTRPGIRRSSVLKRYAANLGAGQEPLFDDIHEVFLSLDEDERKRMDQVARAFGYEVIDGEVDVYLGPQYRLVVRASEEPGGITGFRVSLREDVEEETRVFGKAKLHLKGRSGAFYFGE